MCLAHTKCLLPIWAILNRLSAYRFSLDCIKTGDREWGAKTRALTNTICIIYCMQLSKVGDCIEFDVLCCNKNHTAEYGGSDYHNIQVTRHIRFHFMLKMKLAYVFSICALWVFMDQREKEEKKMAGDKNYFKNIFERMRFFLCGAFQSILPHP